MKLLALMLSVAMLPAQQQVFRSRADVVSINASIKRGGRSVAGMAAADFELRDNGVVQTISAVSVERLPLDVTFLLDLSGSVNGAELQRLKSAVIDATRLLRKDDRIRLVVMSQVLHEVFGFQSPEQPMPLDLLAAQGGTSLYDGLAAAMMHPSPAGRQQLVVAFTDGRDSTSIVDEATMKEIARASDAMVDIVVPIGKPQSQSQSLPAGIAPQAGNFDPLAFGSGANVVGGTPAELAARSAALKPWAPLAAVPPVLEQFVSPTGGEVIPLDTGESISRAFKSLVEDFRASYVLQYEPKGVQPGGWHEVTVKVTRPGNYDIRARKGYGGGTA